MKILYESTDKVGIKIHYGKTIVGVEENGHDVVAKFSDGTVETANFLLGCDGLHSAVRKIYVDPEVSPEYSGMSSIFSLIPTAGLPPTARSLQGLNATLTTDGMFAVTPCNNSSDKIFWFFSREVAIPASGDTRDGWEERGKKEVESVKENLLALIKDSEGEWGELLREIVRQTEVLKFYPVFSLPLGGKWSRGRCLIIGDAAHAMQPHAGQGVSMALEDVAMLCKILKSGKYSLEDTFKVYGEKRRPRVEEMYKIAERNGNVRKKTGPWQLWMNELGISGALWVYQLLGVDKLGLGQKPVTYDIDNEEI